MNFKAFVLSLCVLSLFSFNANAQLQYYVPTQYQGLFNMQPSSARATGMGLTTITLSGVENSFYNPATISLVEEDLEVHINYARGSQVYRGGQFPFLGVTYRVYDKLRIGVSTVNWIDQKDSPWTTIIGGYEESVKRRSQSAYNLMAAYEVISGLHVGLAGNFLVERAVEKTVTNWQYIMSAGAIYDLKMKWIKTEAIQNNKLRFAASFVNLFMKNNMTQTYEQYYHYRDLPIHFYLGTSYHFSVPFRESLFEGKKCLEGASRSVDISVHLQYREVLRGRKRNVVNTNYKNNSSFGFGIEAWWMQLVALRLGYYFEKRPSEDDPYGGYWATDNKKGFTWGFGGKIPWNRWSNGKVPLNAEVNLVISKLLNEYGNTLTVPEYFANKQLLFAFGLNLKWIKKQPSTALEVTP